MTMLMILALLIGKARLVKLMLHVSLYPLVGAPVSVGGNVSLP